MDFNTSHSTAGGGWILSSMASKQFKTQSFHSLTKEKELNKKTSACREEPGAKDVMGKRHLKGR